MTKTAKTTAATGQAGEVLDVLVIGAGFSGVCTGIKLLENGVSNFRIIEKSQGIGGTWYDNTYPGAACDVPSHLYCFSFEPNPGWTRVYSLQPEIQKYVEHCVDKYGLRPFIEHGVKLEELRFDDESAVWRASYQDGRQQLARHVISGAGGLHEPSYPDIPGRESFGGPSMHTARWDHDVDLAGKRVAVIGTAASAIQAIPEIARVAGKLFVFQRTPNYIAPRMDRAYTDKEKARFAKWPRFARLYRWFIFMRMELLLFPLTRKDSRLGRAGGKRLKQRMRNEVRNPALHKALEPDYTLGCKRILTSDDFYRTLNRDNVQIITAGIERIEPHRIVTADQAIDVDVIVFATGFDIDAHTRSIRVYGQQGRSLQEEWLNGPEAYQGACVSGFPNYYLVTGPNTGVGTTSVVYMIEQQVDFIMKLIKLANDDKVVSVRQDAQQEYNARIHADLKNSVWASGCKSWYLRPDGKIATLYPYNARSFAAQSRRVNLSHFDLLPIPSDEATESMTSAALPASAASHS
ncbi:MAG: NAD(P)/FAD-dependent oxidoreductase [Woeseia sp.]